jgi:hypothetical protein
MPSVVEIKRYDFFFKSETGKSGARPPTPMWRERFARCFGDTRLSKKIKNNRKKKKKPRKGKDHLTHLGNEEKERNARMI